MSTIRYHVNGAALISMQPGTRTEFFSDVGFSENGVNLAFDFQWEPIYTDVSPKQLLEAQYFMTGCTISFGLVIYEQVMFDQQLMFYISGGRQALTAGVPLVK